VAITLKERLIFVKAAVFSFVIAARAIGFSAGEPNGLAFDQGGVAWVCDAGQGAIRNVDPATQKFGTIVERIDGAPCTMHHYSDRTLWLIMRRAIRSSPAPAIRARSRPVPFGGSRRMARSPKSPIKWFSRTALPSPPMAMN
jgi:hypothetical protein